MMSTTSQLSATGFVLRRQKDGSRIQISCPQAVVMHNRIIPISLLIFKCFFVLVIYTTCIFSNRGELKRMQRGKVTVSVWKDNKVVTMMSTTSQPSATGFVLRRQKDGSRIQISCPEVVVMHNHYMGGVDRGDQLRGYYNYRTKSRKLYKYFFHFLLDVSNTSVFILYKHFHSSPSFRTIKQYRLQLARELISNYCSRC